jgi:hypothetical protein
LKRQSDGGDILQKFMAKAKIRKTRFVVERALVWGFTKL